MPQYNHHQLRYLSNTVLAALSTRPLTDTRPANPDNRLRTTASSTRNAGTGSITIPETRRMLAISPEHAGLQLPVTGILIRQSQLQEWRNQASSNQQVSLDRAIELTRKAKNNYQSLPLLWEPVKHPVKGWFCQPNLFMSNRARAATLHLLAMALQTGNVKPAGADEYNRARAKA